MNERRVAPGPEQESVWDYPRPPRVEGTARHVRVVFVFGGEVIADPRRAQRVLETSQVANAAWFYPGTALGYEAIQGHVAFYPDKVDACTVDGERVRPQAGGFYGGWTTSEIAGPFKGAPGTAGW